VDAGNKATEAESEKESEDSKMQKKKAKRDLKWWQMEGKRRSQRVRGNLVPTLKNIIPSSLL
jgi:hypothetical protein